MPKTLTTGLVIAVAGFGYYTLKSFIISRLRTMFTCEVENEMAFKIRKLIEESGHSELLADLEPGYPLQTVLFFPDDEITCPSLARQQQGGEKCLMPKCQMRHSEASFVTLCNILSLAEHSINICVNVVTNKKLCEVIVEAYRRGVQVKIIIDRSQCEFTGTQMGSFIAAGIKDIRYNRSNAIMHHKFVLLDDQLLLNGSFNWTHSATFKNHENLIITTEEELIRVYKNQFDQLWKAFAFLPT